eukprot:7830755-Pyramimonas_sp.AAC.1
MAQRHGGGSNRVQSTWRCSACGCNRNKLSWFWCKHCGTKWQKQGAWQNEGDGLRFFGVDRHHQPLRPGPLAAGAPPQTGAAAVGGARDGAVQPGLLTKDLALLIDLTGRAGDKESANKYQEQLSKLTACPVVPVPLEQRVAQCQRERERERAPSPGQEVAVRARQTGQLGGRDGEAAPAHRFHLWPAHASGGVLRGARGQAGVGGALGHSRSRGTHHQYRGPGRWQ